MRFRNRSWSESSTARTLAVMDRANDHVQLSAERLLRIEEVAYLCGVSAATVRRWCTAGQLDAVNLPGAGLRVRHRSVERLARAPRDRG